MSYCRPALCVCSVSRSSSLPVWAEKLGAGAGAGRGCSLCTALRVRVVVAVLPPALHTQSPLSAWLTLYSSRLPSPAIRSLAPACTTAPPHSHLVHHSHITSAV